MSRRNGIKSYPFLPSVCFFALYLPFKGIFDYLLLFPVSLVIIIIIIIIIIIDKFNHSTSTGEEGTPTLLPGSALQGCSSPPRRPIPYPFV